MGDRIVLRLPTLEIYSQLSGGAFSTSSRALTSRERDIATLVFQESLDLDVVQILQSPVVSAPTTLGNNIRAQGAMSDGTLVHELTHIWQYQNLGSGYISDSLWHQAAAAITTGSRDGAYNARVEAGRRFTDYSAEHQATIVERWATSDTYRNDPNYQALIDEVRRARPLQADVRRRLFLEEAAYGPSMAPRLQALPPLGGTSGSGDFFLGGAGVPQIRLEF